MTDSSGDRNPVERLAEEFIARKRRGENPSLSEYTEQYPELADEIRDVFPALLMMENLGNSLQAPTGPHIGGGLTVSQIGDYRILREVGRGGMGVVFEAEQLSLGRRVALKVLPPYALKNEQQVRRFEREARAAARLHHTNIVPVFGVGHREATHYYVMQFIQGLGLDGVIQELRRLRAGKANPNPNGNDAPAERSVVQQAAESLLTGIFQPDVPSSEPVNAATPSRGTESGCDSTVPRFPEGSGLSNASGADRRYWRSVARIGVQVAEALEHAHSQGVLHRDIKPSNLLLDTKGTVWVTDFGLAKTGEEDALTETGDVVGTLRYLAPERFRSAGDARSDVYSLGLTLYELLALRPAFNQRDRPQLMQEVLHGEPPRLREINRAVPRDLATIVHKAIAKEPRQRYDRAADLAADLQRFLDERPIQARPIGNVEVLLKWVKRRPTIAALLALVFVVTVAGLAAFGWQYAEVLRESANARNQAHLKDVEAELKEQALEQAQRNAEEAGRKEKIASENAKLAREKEQDVLRSLDSLKRTLFTAQLVRAGSLAASDPEAALELLEDPEACPPEMRDFSWAFYHGQANRSRWALPSQGGSIDEFALSADGKTLATHYDAGTVAVWDLDSGKARFTLPGTWADKTFLLFSPDGKVLYTCGTDPFLGLHHGLERWETATGRSLGMVQPSVQSGISPVLSRDGRRLAVASDKLTIWEMSETGCQQAAALPLGHHKLGTPLTFAFSPDGQTIALADDPPQGTPDRSGYLIELRDVATNKERLRLNNPSNVHGLVFSGDGKSLYVAGGAGLTQWDTATGKRLDLLEPAAAHVMRLELSADNKTLVGGSSYGGVTVWDLQTGKVRTFLRSARTPLAVSPDGLTLFTASPNGAILRWNVSPETAVPVIKEWKPTIDPRGRRLVSSFTPDARHKVHLSIGASLSLHDARKGQVTGTIQDVPRQHEVVFSLNGKTLAILVDGEVWLCDSRSGKDRGTFATLAGDLAFSPRDSFCVAEVGRRTRESVAKIPVIHSYVEALKIWDLTAKKEVGLLKAAQGPVVFSPDGKLFAGVEAEPPDLNANTRTTRRKPLRVKVWETATGRERITIDRTEPLAFSPDSGSLLVCGNDSTVPVLWDLAANRPRFVLDGVDLRQTPLGRNKIVVDDSKIASITSEKTELMGQTINVAFSPDGKLLASANAEGNVILWDTTQGTETRRLRGHHGPVLAMTFSADGKTLATGGEDRTVRLWDVPAGRIRHVLHGHTGRIASLAFDAGETVLVSKEDETTLKIWNVADGREYRFHGGAPRCTAAALSPDGTTLATASGLEVHLWDARSGKRVGTLEGHTAEVTILAFSADGKGLTSRSGVEVKEWNWKIGKVTASRLIAPPAASSRSLSPDGRTLLLQELDTLTLYDVQTGELRGRLEGVTGTPSFAPDGNRFAVAAEILGDSGRMTPVARLWNAAGGRELAVLRGAERVIGFSGDGKTVAGLAEGPAVVLWDTATGKERGRLSGDWMPAALGPTGDRILVQKRDKSLALWTLAGSSEPKPLPEAALPAIFTADGKTLATAGARGGILLWDVAEDKPSGRLEGHDRGVTTLVFAPDARTLVSVAPTESGRTLKLWDVAGRRERGSLSLKLLPSQQTAASLPPLYTADGKMVLWNVLGTLRRLQVESGKESPLPEEIRGTSVSAVSPDGRRFVVTRGADHWLFDSVTSRVRTVGGPLSYGQTASWRFTNEGKKVVEQLSVSSTLQKSPPAVPAHRFLVFDVITGAAIAQNDPGVADAASRRPRIRVRTAYPSDTLFLSETATGRHLGKLTMSGTTTRKRARRTPTPAVLSAFSPDGKLLATVEGMEGEPNTVRLWDLASGEIRTNWTLGRLHSRILRLAFRADGQMLFALNDKELYRCDLTKGKVESVSLPLAAWPTPALRRDGKLIAYATAGEVRLFDVEADTTRPLVKLANVIALEMPPDGQFLAVLVRDGNGNLPELRVFDLKTEKHLWSVRTPVTHTGALIAFSADGRTCASYSAFNKIQLWDSATGKECGTYTQAGLVPFALAPDGKSLAVNTTDRGISIREIVGGQEVHKLPFIQSAPNHSLRFSPDGKTLFIAPNGGPCVTHCLLWSPDGDTLRFFPHEQMAAHSLAVSPDGQRLAVSGAPSYGVPTALPLTVHDTKTARALNLGLWQEGHGISAFSPNGKLLAFAGDHGTRIRLWDFDRRTLRDLPRNHTEGVLALAFSPDSKTLASAGRDQTVRLWNLAEGKQTAVLEGLTGNATVLGFVSGGKWLIAAALPRSDAKAGKIIAGEARIWDTVAATPRSNFALRERAECAALSPDGTVLAVAGSGGKITIWDVLAGKERIRLDGPQWIHCVAFSPDGKSLATACQNEAPRLWDWVAGRERKNHFHSDPAWPHTGRGISLAFSPDGKTLYLAGRFQIERELMPHAVWHYDVRTGKDRGPFGSTPSTDPAKAQTRNFLVTSAFSGDGRTLACAWHNLVDIWDLSFTPGSPITGSLRTTLRLPPTLFTRFLALRPDGKRVATVDQQNRVDFWDSHTGQSLATWALEGKGPITGLHFSPDDKWLVIVAGKDIYLYDGETATAKTVLSGHDSRIAGVAFGTGGTLLSRSDDGEVKLWDLITGKESLSVHGRPGLLPIQGLASDGKTALTRQPNLADGAAPGHVVRHWDIATGRQVGRPQEVASNDFFSPDQSTRLTIQFDASLRLLDLTTSQERLCLPLDAGIQQPRVVFSLDGKRVAVVGRESIPSAKRKKDLKPSVEQLVQFWDLPTARRLASYHGILSEFWQQPGVYNARAPFVVFSPDNRLAALVEMDPAPEARRRAYGDDVRVLDLTTGKARTLIHSREVTSLAFSADGRILANGGHEKVHLWDTGDGKELRTLAHHPGRWVEVVGFAVEDTVLVLNLKTPRQAVPEPREEGHELVLWDVAADRLRASLRGAGLPVAISPNGRSLAAVPGDGPTSGGHLIQIWDAFTGHQRALLRGHRDRVNVLRFAPDGETLISHGLDGILRWQTAWPDPGEREYRGGTATLWKLQRKLKNPQPSTNLNVNLVLAAKRFVQALERKPDHLRAYAALAGISDSADKLDTQDRRQIRSELLAILRRLVQVCPNRAEAHYLLAGALEEDSSTEALEHYRQTIACDPRHAEALARIGYLSLAAGQEEQALSAFRNAVALKPGCLQATRRPSDPAGHVLRRVAGVFERHSRWDDAILIHQVRIAVAPNDARVQLDLAHALRRRGQMAESLAAYRRVQQLGGKTGLHAPERWAELERKLPTGTGSRIESADAGELLALANLALFKLRSPTAARCYAAALAANPRLTDERFHAACAAVLAGTSADKEAAGLTEAERAGWRKQALDWLRADLAALQKDLEAKPSQATGPVYASLSSWRTEVDLIPVRDGPHESRLPQQEREAWAALWADVEALWRQAAFVPTGLWWVDGKEIAQEQKTASACWLWLGDTGWTDYDLEVEAQRVEGPEGFAVGFRMTDKENFLVANFGGWENRRNGVEVMTEGDVHVLWASGHWPPIETGRWYRVRIQARGNRFRVLLDDAEVLSFTEVGHPRGAVGLRSWNTVNRFRNLKVSDPRGKVLFEGLPVLQPLKNTILATTLGQRRRWGEAAEAFAAVFADNPALARGVDRYNAACAAARAGTDAADRDEKARARFRNQAHDWLRGELAARRADFEKAPSLATARDMGFWQNDADFQAVRDSAALARLPAAEAERWKKLWAEVADLRRRAERQGAGAWKIEGNELIQVSPTGEAIIIFGDPKWDDYDVHLEMKPTRGAGELNVLVRAAGVADFTAAILGGWSNTRHGIAAIVGGRWGRGMVANGKTKTDQWLKIKVEVRGRTCRLFVNDSLVVSSREVPAAAGQAGLRTLETAGRFRNIKVTDPRGKVLFEGLPELPSRKP